MRSRAGAVIIKDGKILLMHRFKNGEEYFVFSGGGIKEGETPEMTAIRELKEEMNIDIVLDRLLIKIVDKFGNDGTYFLAKSFTGDPKLSGEEKERMNENNQYYPVWLDLQEALKLDNLYPHEVRDKLSDLYLPEVKAT